MAIGIEIRPGTCRYCGSTCAAGLLWIDAQHTVCSAPRCAFQYFSAHPEDEVVEPDEDDSEMADQPEEYDEYEDLEEHFDAA